VREELNERQALVREELNERQALVREELNERQALVREELNQETMKMAKEKERQIVEEKVLRRLYLWSTHPLMQEGHTTMQAIRELQDRS